MTDQLFPPKFAKHVIEVSLEYSMKSAYIDYAMSVIVGRALPDVRDGLKPVHRRTLYAMSEMGNDWNKPFKKSARVVGDVLGKYHPHGQDAVYDALVRMAQSFSMRVPLVQGQGNFGSIDGDNPAAMRYTEVRLARITHSLLDDLDKDTVDFTPNYDGAEHEPTVMPAQFPNLLVNGTSGIAVGMATNIPPHNISEVIDACSHLIANPDASIDDLMQFIPAPDFPTSAYIYGASGARDAYLTGRGRVVMRAKTHIEDIDKNQTRQAIIIDELPYQVNKANVIIRIAELVRDKKIDGISDLRDESDRQGIRVVIELRRGINVDVMLNNLFKETSLQESFSVNMVALIDGAPKQLNLLEILNAFIRFRREVVVRRALFNLRKARNRAHLLEGFAVAVANVDEIVDLIKKSNSPAEAEAALLAKQWRAESVQAMLSRLESPELIRPDDIASGGLILSNGSPFYCFSLAQAKAILDLRLARLTAMERDKIQTDYTNIVQIIVDLLILLADNKKIDAVILDELTDIKKQFGEERRSEIIEDEGTIDNEQLIPREDMVVTFSHRGYVKRQAVSDYRTQRRGGRGKQAATTREDDFLSQIFVASTHDYLLILDNRGRVHWKKVYELPLASRTSKGRPIAGLLDLINDEKIQTVLPLANFEGERYVVMVTEKGTIKKTHVEAFSRPRKKGIAAINLDDDDSLVSAAITTTCDSILLLSDHGKAVHFKESDLRTMGRAARGVRGMKIKDKSKIVSMIVFSPNNQEKGDNILIATQKGMGKRTNVSEFQVKGRGGLGVISLRVTDKTGNVIGACLTNAADDVMLITDGGVLVRTSMQSIRRAGRATQGVRLINLDDGTSLVSIARIVEVKNEDDDIDGIDDTDDSLV